MIQQPWQTPLASNLTESSTEQSAQIRYIHLYNTNMFYIITLSDV